MKPDQMVFQFVLFRRSKTYEGIKKACLEYVENIKMMESSAIPIFQKVKKIEKDSKDNKIDELCKQIQNLNLMIMQQPRRALKQREAVCCKYGKKDHYASQCRIDLEPTCYWCVNKGQRASECRSKIESPPNCTYCHRFGHTVENSFIQRSNEAVDKQDYGFRIRIRQLKRKKPRHLGIKMPCLWKKII